MIFVQNPGRRRDVALRAPRRDGHSPADEADEVIVVIIIIVVVIRIIVFVFVVVVTVLILGRSATPPSMADACRTGWINRRRPSARDGFVIDWTISHNRICFEQSRYNFPRSDAYVTVVNEGHFPTQ